MSNSSKVLSPSGCINRMPCGQTVAFTTSISACPGWRSPSWCLQLGFSSGMIMFPIQRSGMTPFDPSTINRTLVDTGPLNIHGQWLKRRKKCTEFVPLKTLVALFTAKVFPVPGIPTIITSFFSRPDHGAIVVGKAMGLKGTYLYIYNIICIYWCCDTPNAPVCIHVYVYMCIYIYIPGYSLVTNFFPGQILVWFLTIFWRFTHFKTKMTISRKHMPLHVLIFESWWICPGISALFPGISAFFPGNSAQKNRHIFTQSRVRSAQKAQNPKLTTIIKKWPLPAPSQEIRPKGRNLGNGHLFVSFRRSRYTMNYELII